MVLAEFLLIVLGIIFISISALILQQLLQPVTFIPSSDEAINAMLEMANLKPGMHVVDLGAGDARVLVAAMQKEPRISAEGYEIGWIAWLLGSLRIYRSQFLIKLHLKNLFAADLSKADVVFVYLWPSLMEKLNTICIQKLRPGTLVISKSFVLSHRKAVEERTVNSGKHTYTIRAYRF